MTAVHLLSEREKRDRFCKKLGLGNVVQAHQFIASAAGRGPDLLLRKQLRAPALIELGYSAEALRKLGFTSIALEKLGFEAPDARVKSDPNILKKAPTPVVRAEEGGAVIEQLRTLIESGMRAEGLLGRGYNALICKKAGLTAEELTQLGFDLHTLRAAFRLPELKRAGYNAMDLRRYYSGAELQQAGFGPSEMRNAGFTPKQLLTFGYSENAVATAGFSIVELTDAGLSNRTVDRRGFP
jgi:intracellular multiplication protein IcmE